MTSNTCHFSLRAIIYALSDAVGFVGVDDILHGKRVGYMAYQIAKHLGNPRLPQEFMFDLGVLHDIGVSSTKVFKHLVGEFEWENADQHCEVGFQRLSKFGPLAPFAIPVRYHHTHWSEMPLHLRDDATGLQANLIYMVDRIDALSISHHADQTLLSATPEIRKVIDERANSYFCPLFVQAFLDVSKHEAFWLGLDERSIRFFEQERLEDPSGCEIEAKDFKGLAEIFAEVVDAKSVFTFQHSKGVAKVAGVLARKLGLPEDRCEAIEVSGLLHDIGKLRVPDEILDKPGPLDRFERSIMNTHSYETFQLLRRIQGLEDIARWAAFHHEEPGASGYPFGLEGETLPMEARILRVADIIQAVAQDRPYRRGMTKEQTAILLKGLLEDNKIDPTVGRMALSSLEDLMVAALVTPPPMSRVASDTEG